MDGLTIQNAIRAGMRIDNSHHVTVRNCTFANNGTWGLFTDFTTVEDCESYGAADEHGIYISNSSDYPTIRGNRLHHNNGCGLHMNGDISMGGDGIISYALVERNIIYENGAGGGSGINMDGVTNSVIRNNPFCSFFCWLCSPPSRRPHRPAPPGRLGAYPKKLFRIGPDGSSIPLHPKSFGPIGQIYQPNRVANA